MNGQGGRARGRGRGRTPNGGNGQRPGGPGAGAGATAGVDGAAAAMQGMALQQRGGGSRRERGPVTAADLDFVPTREKDETGRLKTKQGDKGTPVQLYSNYIQLKRKPNVKVLQYRVDFNIDIDSTGIKKGVFKRLQYGKQLPAYLFDGTVLFTIEPLFNHRGQNSVDYTSSVRLGDEEKPCVVTVKLVGEIHSTDFHYLQVLNTIKARFMAGLQMTQLGRDYFDTNNPINVPSFNLQVLNGYKSSIRQHENDVLLNIEVAHKVIRTDTVNDQIRALTRNGAGNHDAIRRALTGCIVITMYNKKTYRIDDVDFNQNADSTFTKKDGSKISYWQYYEETWKEKIGGSIRDHKQPLLVSTPKDKDKRRGDCNNIMLLPEICHMTGLTDEMRNNNKIMEALSEHTRKAPTPRVREIQRFLRAVGQEAQCRDVMRDWEMELDQNLISLKARIQDPIKIQIGNGKTCDYASHNADWSNAYRVDRNSQPSGMNEPADITNWLFVYPRSMYENVCSMYREFQFVSKGLRVRIQEPEWEEINDNNPGAGVYINTLKRKGPLHQKYHFVVVAIKSNMTEHYSAIKKHLYIQDPIPNQILTGLKTLFKAQKHRTFATKIVLQMSAKLGGTPWKVPIPAKSTCVLGYDTYHDTVNKKKSFGALVASVNQSLVKYVSVVTPHDNFTEMSNNIKVMFTQAMRKYKKNNNTYPKQIVFYRDGVGDGQLDHVLNTEVKSIQGVLQEMAAEDGMESVPQLCFIVVSKRINTRFFSRGQRPGEYGNPFSGTTVDDVVTLPERYDFFLISQSVRQGTVNPTSYNVIFNNTKWSPSILQSLTYRLTHLYFNWPGTVRVPAPCQYAHKLAYLVGESLHQQPNPHLEEYLYYL